MPDQGGEKTEQASPKKREDERKKGNIFQSKDVVTIFSLIVAFYVLRFFVGRCLEQLQIFYGQQLERAVHTTTLQADEAIKIFSEFGALFATTMLPPMMIIGFAAVVASLAQTRFLFSTEQIKFKLERISPIKGFKRMFSMRSLVELAKSLIKISVLCYIIYKNILGTLGYLPSMIDWDISQAVSFAGSEILSLVSSVAIAFGAVAALDFLYQRYEYEKGIKMTKQEVKDEYKQMEGNPEIKSARRQKQREFAQRRMMQQVKDADVIVRNPTHYAVAIKYTIEVDPAPIILAKGADLIAQKILDEAQKHNIVMIENPPLARGLYDAADVLGYIPAEFFQPVAELLAWLFTARERGIDPHSEGPPILSMPDPQGPPNEGKA